MSAAPVVLALALLGAFVVLLLALLAGCALAAAALDLLSRLRSRADDPALAAARAGFYAEIDRVAVVSELGEEVDANVFPLPRRAPAEVLPFPTKPAA